MLIETSSSCCWVCRHIVLVIIYNGQIYYILCTSTVFQKLIDQHCVLLKGNKCDSEDRAVGREDGERLAREYKVNFMETSAKTGLNVESAFVEVAR